MEKETKPKEDTKAPKRNLTKKITTQNVVIVLALLVFFALGYAVNFALTGMMMTKTGASLTADEAANKAVDYLNNNILQSGVAAELMNVTETSGVYGVLMTIKTSQGSQNATVYVTEDGKMMFVSAIPMEEPISKPEPDQSVPKSDRPEAHAFIMSYCPYGLQFLKAYIPVMELLGDKADLEVNFVHYAMHGKKELDENTRMYCVQKEEPDKFTDYLRCSVQTEEAEKETCLDKAGIDKTKIESCIASTDEQFNITGLYNDQSTWVNGHFPQYPVDAVLANQYGVGGSPTFIINGKTVNVERSAEAVKEAVCSAFNTPPEECSQALSTDSEAPGIGPLGSGSGSGSSGAC